MKLKNFILSTTLFVSATAFSVTIKDGEKIDYFEGNKIESISQETKIDSNFKKENLKIRIDFKNFKKREIKRNSSYKFPSNKEESNGYFLKIFNKIVAENSSVEEWSFSQNHLSDESLAFFLNILKKNKSIKTLCLGENCIGEKSAKEIIDILNKNNLTKLNLEAAASPFIVIEDDALSQIVNALKQNKSLIVLNLSGKIVTEKIGKLILKMLKTNKTLQKIKILRFNNENSMSHKTFCKIREILKARKHNYKDILIEFFKY